MGRFYHPPGHRPAPRPALRYSVSCPLPVPVAVPVEPASAQSEPLGNGSAGRLLTRAPTDALAAHAPASGHIANSSTPQSARVILSSSAASGGNSGSTHSGSSYGSTSPTQRKKRRSAASPHGSSSPQSPAAGVSVDSYGFPPYNQRDFDWLAEQDAVHLSDRPHISVSIGYNSVQKIGCNSNNNSSSNNNENSANSYNNISGYNNSSNNNNIMNNSNAAQAHSHGIIGSSADLLIRSSLSTLAEKLKHYVRGHPGSAVIAKFKQSDNFYARALILYPLLLDATNRALFKKYFVASPAEHVQFLTLCNPRTPHSTSENTIALNAISSTNATLCHLGGAGTFQNIATTLKGAKEKGLNIPYAIALTPAVKVLYSQSSRTQFISNPNGVFILRIHLRFVHVLMGQSIAQNTNIEASDTWYARFLATDYV